MLEKIFIKDYKDVTNPKVRTAYGILVSIIGIVSNVILSVSKMIIGILSGSISIIADGIDNLSDCASNIATLFGFKLANLPPDPRHPFGHERIEYITTMIISIIILMVGILLFEGSIRSIISKNTLNVDSFYVLIGILIFSIVVKFLQFLYYKRIAKKIESNTIKATSQDSLNDAIKTIFVLIAIIVFKVWNVNLDGYLGIAVSIYIMINGFLLILDASNPLIGEAPSKELTDSITKNILDYEGVLGIHDLVIHNYGPDKTFVTVHVEVDSRRNILDIHDDMDNIERDFKEKFNLDLTIHMDPVELTDPLTNKLKEATTGILNFFDKKLKFHDFRIVSGPTHINVLFDVVVPIKYDLNDEKVKKEITSLTEQGLKKIANKEINVIINVDKDYVL